MKELIDGYLDDALTAEEMVQLTAWLEADPAHLRQFVETVARDEQLRLAVQTQSQLRLLTPEVDSHSGEDTAPTMSAIETGGPKDRGRPAIAMQSEASSVEKSPLHRNEPTIRANSDEAEPSEPQPSLSRPRHPHPQPPVRWAAAAAAVLLLCGLAMLWRASTRSAVEVEVVTAEGAQLSDRAASLQAGEHLRLHELRLKSGAVTLRLPNGVRLELTGPALAHFEDPLHLRLRHGRLSADVGPLGKGFTVVTDAGEVVDLGTRFGIEAERGGESRVAVFSGQVKVRQGAAGGEFTTLQQGEAVRFTALAGLRRWTQVALAVDAEGLERVPADSVLAEVRDNLGDEQLHPFYGVVRGGMKPGALAFTDKPNPRWAPSPADRLPDELLGADLVRTYYQFRLQRNYELTLTLRERAAVFVLIDRREPPPDWLSARFTDTGASVPVGPWMQILAKADGAAIGEDGHPYLDFALWRAEAEAGEFVLGAAHSSRAKTVAVPLMYGVAVKALAPP